MPPIPHPKGTKTRKLTISHKGEDHEIHIPADRGVDEGARIMVEFPDGKTAYTEGWDETERAQSAPQPVVPCLNCGALNQFAEEFACVSCGKTTRIELKTSGDSGEGTSSEG